MDPVDYDLSRHLDKLDEAEMFESAKELAAERLAKEAALMLADPTETSTAPYYEGQNASVVFGEMIFDQKDADDIMGKLLHLVSVASVPNHPMLPEMAKRLQTRLVDMYVEASVEKLAQEIYDVC